LHARAVWGSSHIILMAPILSKAVPPASPYVAMSDAVEKTFPAAVDALLAVLEAAVTGGNKVAACAHHLLESAVARVDEAVFVCAKALHRWNSALSLRSSLGKSLQDVVAPLFVVTIIYLLYNAFVFGYMPLAGIALNSPTSLIFHAFIFMILASLAQAFRTDPGSIPETAMWRTYQYPPPVVRERKRNSGGPRWCRKSNAYKPDRCHYCTALERPVLRMDHHCPWLGNTVGFKNHKYFFLFLLYTNAACTQLGLSLLQLLVHATLPALASFSLIGAEGLTFLLSSLLLPFFFFHCYLLCKNMTTIEFHAMMCSEQTQPLDHSDRASTKATGADSGSPYDLGVYGNLCSVLGTNPLMWFVPLGGPSGDGLSFPLSSQASGVASFGLTEVNANEDLEAAAKLQLGKHDEEEVVEVGVSASLVALWSPSTFVDDVAVGCQVLGGALQDSLCLFASVCAPKPAKARPAGWRRSTRHLLPVAEFDLLQGTTDSVVDNSCASIAVNSSTCGSKRTSESAASTSASALESEGSSLDPSSDLDSLSS